MLNSFTADSVTKFPPYERVILKQRKYKTLSFYIKCVVKSIFDIFPLDILPCMGAGASP